MNTWYVIVPVLVLAVLGVLLYASRKRTSGSSTPAASKGPAASRPDGRSGLTVPRLIAAERFPEALEMLISQSDFKGAARVAMKMDQFSRAAELFDRAGDMESAANAFLRVPDIRRAADYLSRAGHHARSAELYTQVDDLWAAAEELVAAGHLEQAAALLRHLGKDTEAARLSARILRDNGMFLEAAKAFAALGEHEATAECLELGGRLVEAADAFRRAGAPDRGALLLEKAGDFNRAAEMHRHAGNHARAASIYQKLHDSKGEVQSLVEAGSLFDAAHLAYKQGARDKAEDILKMMTSADRGYNRGCLLLGWILEDSGRSSEAARYLQIYVDRNKPSGKTLGVWERTYRLLDRQGLPEQALKVLRKIEAEGLLDNRLLPEIQRLEDTLDIERSRPVQKPDRERDDRSIVPPGLPERYVVVRRLGEGGTAIVYLAKDTTLRRDVVLKFLSNPNLPEDLAEEYFLREAQIVAGMSHPGIVQVFDVGKVAGRHYMVMEFIDGETLDQVLLHKPGHVLSLPRVAAMAVELTEALAYAHDRKVIHRDIKPGNTMVLPDGHVKLMDFGMAKALEVHRDRSLYICGTPDYMSPEQEAGFDLTSATDIYSFALLLLESLLGPMPSGLTAAMARQSRVDFLERSSLPAPIQRLLKNCLELEPGRRPSSVKEIGATFKRYS